jgi:hypothetical protein
VQERRQQIQPHCGLHRPSAPLGALAALLVAAPLARGQDLELDPARARWRATFERLDPGGPDDLWVTGIHYDLLDRLSALPGAYLGVGGYGATLGDRGGMLAAGVTVGIRDELSPSWILDVGTFLGGGGGGLGPGDDPNEAWGLGAYLRPHIALEYGSGRVRWRFELSHVEVPSGDLSSTQIALGIQGFDELLLARYSFEDLALIDSDALVEGSLPLELSNRWLFPIGDSERLNGSDIDNSIGLAGIGLERSLGEGWYAPFELAGGVAGSVSGYAQFLAGLGKRTWLVDDRIGIYGQGSLGFGGGGQVDTGGGLLLAGEAGLEFQMLHDWTANLGAVLQSAPTGDFHALGLALGASYSPVPLELRADYPRSMLGEEGLYSFDVELEPWTFEVLQKVYSLSPSARLKDGSPIDGDQWVAGLGAVKRIRRNLDLSVRAAAAWNGDLPGYHEGQIGARWTIPVLEPLDPGDFFVQYHAGVTGGGELDNGSGLTHEVVAGWRWRPIRGWRFGFEVGHVNSERGSFEGDVMALSLSFGATRALIAD